ncbi:hypothetical protein ACIBG8_08760 [Nonomuraea sp. NPDC050556]|uniref:hypothetical protein n=1 Tax=Nonomuraea sp. NPDC050556 TaxID=3364369 RepID=UPI0037AC2C31
MVVNDGLELTRSKGAPLQLPRRHRFRVLRYADGSIDVFREDATTTQEEENMSTDDWEGGPDAARSVGARPERLEARVQLVFGARAEVVTAYHPSGDPLRVPAAELAEQLGVGVGELAGVRFTAEIVDDAVRAARLIR